MSSKLGKSWASVAGSNPAKTTPSTNQSGVNSNTNQPVKAASTTDAPTTSKTENTSQPKNSKHQIQQFLKGKFVLH
jgi:hypothetical protein